MNLRCWPSTPDKNKQEKRKRKDMRPLTWPSSSFENDTNVHTKFWNEICLVTCLINGFAVMRWSHHKVMKRNLEEEREWKRGIVFRLCSVKGEITHLLIFFSPKDGHHRSYIGIYEPISNMKYRHQESILPLFFTFSPLNRSQLLAFLRYHWSCFIYSQTRKIKGFIPFQWTLPLTSYLI